MSDKQNKWDRRDRKRNKRRYGMRVSGRSTITVQQNLAYKKARREKEQEESDYYER